MKPTSFKQILIPLTGLLLSLPTVYFILISILKYVFGYDYLFDAIAPTLESWGIKEPPGWNINLLILFGPLTALLLNILSVLHIHFNVTKEKIDCHVSVHKSWWNLAVIILSGLVLLILFTYLLGENCSC